MKSVAMSALPPLQGRRRCCAQRASLSCPRSPRASTFLDRRDKERRGWPERKWGLVVSLIATSRLTIVTDMDTLVPSRSSGRLRPRVLPEGGAGAALRARRYTVLPGGLGIMSPGITTGAGSVPWTGTGTASNARSRPRPRKHGLTLSQRRRESPWQDRGGTPTGELPLKVGQSRTRSVRRLLNSVCRRSASFRCS